MAKKVFYPLKDNSPQKKLPEQGARLDVQKAVRQMNNLPPFSHSDEHYSRFPLQSMIEQFVMPEVWVLLHKRGVPPVFYGHMVVDLDMPLEGDSEYERM